MNADTHILDPARARAVKEGRLITSGRYLLAELHNPDYPAWWRAMRRRDLVNELVNANARISATS